MRIRACVGVAFAAALLTAAVGCGSSPPSPGKFTGSPPIPTGSAPSTVQAGHVGADCGFIPAHGAGSFGSMSGQRAATATSSNPQLSVFSSAIRSASLQNELNRMHSFTLFIPVNSAFAALSHSEITFLRNPANLVKVVRRQVVPINISPAQIARGGSATTLSGNKLALAKSGPTFRVNGATILCGNIRTANGTLYVIDKVLLPPK